MYNLKLVEIRPIVTLSKVYAYYTIVCMYVLTATISAEIALLSCSLVTCTCMCYYQLIYTEQINDWLIDLLFVKHLRAAYGWQINHIYPESYYTLNGLATNWRHCYIDLSHHHQVTRQVRLILSEWHAISHNQWVADISPGKTPFRCSSNFSTFIHQ